MPKEAKYIVFSTILPFVAYGMFYTDISFFLTVVQGLDYELMGFIITTIGISTFATSIPLGFVADRFGHRKVFIASNIIASLIIPVFTLTTEVTILIAAALLEGLSEAAFAVSAYALIADKTEGHMRVASFSLFAFTLNIAFGIGSFAIPAATLFDTYGLTYYQGHVLLYASLAVASLLSTILMFKITETQPKKKPGGIAQMFRIKSKGVLIKYALIGAIAAAGAGLFVPLMTAWFNLRYGISDATSGPILGISSFLIGASTLIVPYVSRKIGIVKTIMTSYVTSTFFLVAIPLATNFALSSFMYSVRSFLVNISAPLEDSMIMELVAEDERGIVSGISSALWKLPNAITTYAGALLMGIGFLQEPFFIAAALLLVSALLFWVFFRNFRSNATVESASAPS